MKWVPKKSLFTLSHTGDPRSSFYFDSGDGSKPSGGRIGADLLGEMGSGIYFLFFIFGPIGDLQFGSIAYTT
jgi:hypothetical protein